MAGKNITIAGATFNGVPSIDVPVSGGGTASYVEISDTTAQASDVAQGKFFYDAQGVKTEGLASGGGVDVEALSVTQNGTYTAPTGKAYSPVTVNVSGGASNVVTGTFKGTTTGTAMDITLNYSGSGYPIAVMIYPTEGPYNNQSGSFYNLVQRYAAAYYISIKARANIAPAYNADGTDGASVNLRYKSSASNATSYSASAINTVLNYSDADATSGPAVLVRIRSATKMSVFIASTSYGFAANIEYTYHIIYSS